MAQQVTITTDAQVALKPLLESALRSELHMLELSLQRTSQRLHAFEAQHGLTSDEFERRFNAGKLEESLDFIEWAGEIKTFRLLRGSTPSSPGSPTDLIEDYFRSVETLLAAASIIHRKKGNHGAKDRS